MMAGATTAGATTGVAAGAAGGELIVGWGPSASGV
jgi:hypothetical protein